MSHPVAGDLVRQVETAFDAPPAGAASDRLEQIADTLDRVEAAADVLPPVQLAAYAATLAASASAIRITSGRQAEIHRILALAHLYASYASREAGRARDAARAAVAARAASKAAEIQSVEAALIQDSIIDQIESGRPATASARVAAALDRPGSPAMRVRLLLTRAYAYGMLLDGDAVEADLTAARALIVSGYAATTVAPVGWTDTVSEFEMDYWSATSLAVADELGKAEAPIARTMDASARLGLYGYQACLSATLARVCIREEDYSQSSKYAIQAADLIAAEPAAAVARRRLAAWSRTASIHPKARLMSDAIGHARDVAV